MCSCSEVSQSVKVPVTQMPASTSRPAIAQTPNPLPMNAAWQDAPISIRLATRSANRGFHRSSSRSPSTQPTPNPAVMIAHDFAPSISSAASTGPRTKIAGSTMTWYDAMPPRKAVTHERLRTSDQPSLRLVKKCAVDAFGSSSCSTSATIRGRSGTRQAMDTANVAASNSSAPPGPPANATSRPPSTGPTIEPVE